MPKMFEKSFALFKMFLNIKNCLETFQNVAYIMLIQKVLKKCCSKKKSKLFAEQIPNLFKNISCCSKDIATRKTTKKMKSKEITYEICIT